MKLSDINIDAFNLFHDHWALLTAGSFVSHNSMTISWGEMGTLWNKKVVTVFVKPCRYTYQFMEENEYFVVSFFEEKYRDSLSKMGSVSGEDINKDEFSNLTPHNHNSLTIYKEASLTIICKKIYHNDLDIKQIPEEEKVLYYSHQAPHRMYIGEVIEIIDRR